MIQTFVVKFLIVFPGLRWEKKNSTPLQYLKCVSDTISQNQKAIHNETYGNMPMFNIQLR